MCRDFVRRNLTDKQAMLEASVQRYKTQIASANASLAAKDSLIAHLQKQVQYFSFTQYELRFGNWSQMIGVVGNFFHISVNQMPHRWLYGY